MCAPRYVPRSVPRCEMSAPRQIHAHWAISIGDDRAVPTSAMARIVSVPHQRPAHWARLTIGLTRDSCPMPKDGVAHWASVPREDRVAPKDPIVQIVSLRRKVWAPLRAAGAGGGLVYAI